jgi:hypothetical protein
MSDDDKCLGGGKKQRLENIRDFKAGGKSQEARVLTVPMATRRMVASLTQFSAAEYCQLYSLWSHFSAKSLPLQRSIQQCKAVVVARLDRKPLHD